MNRLNHNSILSAGQKKQWRRVVSFLLALVLFAGYFPIPASSAENGQEQGGESSVSTPNSGELIYDYDTLRIARDGKQIHTLKLQSHEKIEIEAEGLTDDADYQWQVQHPEQDDVWVNIYDGTNQTISVTLALVENVLREDGTVKLRCRAYTETYAYLSNAVTVTMVPGEAAAAWTASATTAVLPLAVGEDDLMPLAEDTEIPEFVSVTIEYIRYGYVLQADGVTFKEEEVGTAFTSYVATLKSQTDLTNKEVHCPTIVGYKPTLKSVTEGGVAREPQSGEFNEAEQAVTINQTNITANVVYRVEYHPDNVNYEVRYFFQNIYDDLYVEDKSIVATAGINDYPVFAKGFTGMHPDKEHTEREFTGFTSLYYEPEIIAADGSTVFHVYYERNYYLMEFNCNGGYGTDTVYVRYGTYISVPDPVRSGWVFAGWDLVQTGEANPPDLGSDPDADGRYDGDGSADTLPAKMPFYNSAYKALWTEADTTYAVAYWILDSEGKKTYIGGRTIGAKSGAVVSGEHDLGLDGKAKCGLEAHMHTADCFQDTRNLIEAEKDTNITVEGDGSTVVNVYYQYKEYTLKFYYAATTGGTATDADRNPDTYDSIKIVGGTTYYFGYSGLNSSDDETLLEYEYWTWSGEWGSVTALPTLNEEGRSRNYTFGSETYEHDGTEVTYHYISFKARYNDNISDMWPCGVFNSATRMYKNNANGWSGEEAFVSAWNGEHHVKYSRNSNQTIKGKYEVLDDNLLFHSDYADETEVSYLCFWENGANINWSVPELYRYNIWLEIRDSEVVNDGNGNLSADGFKVIFRDGVYYKCVDSYDTCDNSDVDSQTQVSLTGYNPITFSTPYKGYQISGKSHFEYKQLSGTDDSTSIATDGYFDNRLYREGYEINFYYAANRHSLKFYNFNGWLGDGQGAGNSQAGEGVQYGTPLKVFGDYVNEDYMKDHYPAGLEPGAYKFGGWYTTELCLPGTEVDWATQTMPDSDLTVYAYWKPVVHNVYFYENYSDYGKGNAWQHTDINGNQVTYPIKVPHGELLGTTYNNTPDAEEGYTFVGWFYIDETGKKRFAPDTMEVKKDLHLFAEWQSGIDTQYEVRYVLEKAYGGYNAGDFVANPTAGHLTAGKTKTFTAKTGAELLSEFRDAPLFPTVNSHSLLMKQESELNRYTFTYVHDDSVWYRIRYVDKITGLDLADAEIKSSTKAIVTEKFKPVEGYLPDNYYIRKVLAADDDAPEPIDLNEIIFYYTPDTTHGLYVVEYYTENLDGTWNLEQSELGSADLGHSVSISIDSDKFSGFTYSYAMVTTYDGNEPKKVEELTASGTVTKNGLEIQIYYIRNSYTYFVKYVEYGTGNVLMEETGTEKFDNTVQRTADNTCESGGTTYLFYATTEKPQTQTMTIRADDMYNVMTFYYQAKTVSIYYKAVCLIPDAFDFGVVSVNFESAANIEGISGCTATAGAGFEFVGWYSDENCQNQISTNSEYRPTALPEEDSVTYYALFKPIFSSLTINKTVDGLPGGMEKKDNFLFRVQGVGKTAYIDIIVSIEGSGSLVLKDLPVGTYKITELTDWSWEYETKDDPQTITVETSTKSVTFTNTYVGSDWLSGEGHYENQFSDVIS